MNYLTFLLGLGLLFSVGAQAQQVPDPLSKTAPGTITGNQTGAMATDAFQFQLKNQVSADADAFNIWKCVVGDCATSPAVGNSDTGRIITVVPAGATVEQAASLAVYFHSKAGRAGPPYPPVPAYVGYNVMGICDASGAGCWGGNVNMNDTKNNDVPAAIPARFMHGWEADFNVSSTNSQVGGFLTGGSSVAQPNAANGYSCLWLDGPSAPPTGQGGTAKWTTCFSSQHGSSLAYADIGTMQVSGANTTSQNINMYYRDADDALHNITLVATPAGLKINTNGAAPSASYIGPGLNLQPTAAPPNPASGWALYTDSGDGNKLKAKASTGTIVLLGTP